MALYGRDPDADEVQRPRDSIMMGRRTIKAQCTTLYVCDSNKEKRSKKLRSILGLLPCSILKICMLGAQTKNKYMMDDFFLLTFREP
jgi:hypothetical protein